MKIRGWQRLAVLRGVRGTGEGGRKEGRRRRKEGGAVVEGRRKEGGRKEGRR